MKIVEDKIENCPQCNSDKIQCDDQVFECGEAWQQLICQECGQIWYEVYRFNHCEVEEEE